MVLRFRYAALRVIYKFYSFLIIIWYTMYISKAIPWHLRAPIQHNHSRIWNKTLNAITIVLLVDRGAAIRLTAGLLGGKDLVEIMYNDCSLNHILRVVTCVLCGLEIYYYFFMLELLPNLSTIIHKLPSTQIYTHT